MGYKKTARLLLQAGVGAHSFYSPFAGSNLIFIGSVGEAW